MRRIIDFFSYCGALVDEMLIRCFFKKFAPKAKQRMDADIKKTILLLISARMVSEAFVLDEYSQRINKAETYKEYCDALQDMMDDADIGMLWSEPS